MDDSTIVWLCAEAMGLPFRELGGEIQFRVPSSRGLNDWVTYRPLHDDAAAMALAWWLIQRGSLTVLTKPSAPESSTFLFTSHSNEQFVTAIESLEHLRRALSETVASLQQAKQK